MKRRTVLGGALAAGAALSMPAYLRAQSNKKIIDPDLEHRRPGGALQGGVRRVPEEEPRRRDRVARQEGTGAAGLLPDAARRRHAARHHQHARGALGRVRRERRAPRPHAIRPEGRRGRQALQRRLPQRTGPTRGRTSCFPSTSPRRCSSTTRPCSRRPASPGRRRASTRSCRTPRRWRRARRPASSPSTSTGCTGRCFKMNGVELLSADGKKAAFNTPKAIEVAGQAREGAPRAAPSTRSPGPAAGSSRTEPSPSGTVGMHHAHSPAFFFVKGQGPWVNADTLGVAHMPGGWSTPNSHGLGVSKGSKNPELAFALLKHMTSDKWTSEFIRRRNVLTGNTASDQAGLERLRKDDPLTAQVLRDAAREHRQDDRQLAAAVRRAAEGRLLSGDPERGARPQGRRRPRSPTPSGWSTGC